MNWDEVRFQAGGHVTLRLEVVTSHNSQFLPLLGAAQAGGVECEDECG